MFLSDCFVIDLAGQPINRLQILLPVAAQLHNNSGQVHTTFTEHYNLIPVSWWGHCASGKVTVCYTGRALETSLIWAPVGFRLVLNKVRTDSNTEFGSNPILVDRIWIESAAGFNPILIIQICTALDCTVDFNEHVTAFTTGTACTPPNSDIKSGHCLVPGTTPIRSADAADASRARWLADDCCRPVSNKPRWLQTYVIDWQPKAANVSR